MPLYVRSFVLIFFLVPLLVEGQAYTTGNLKLPGEISSDTINPSRIVKDSVFHIMAYKHASGFQHKIDSGLAVLNRAIDSVSNITSNPQEYQRVIGRLYTQFDSSFLAPLKSVPDSLGAGLKKRIRQIERSLEKGKGFVDSLVTANQLPSIHDLSSKTKLPLTDWQLPELPTLSGNASLTNIRELKNSLPGLPARPQIPNTDPLNKIGDLMDEVKDYKDQIKGLTETNINADELTERFEKRLADVKGIDALQNGTESVENLQKQMEGMTEKIKDQEKVIEEVKARTKKQFVDHFAGHQDKIESEMKSMEKLQRKYHSVTDVRYLPKRRTNPEKGKPFVERLIIGTSLQIDRENPKWMDIDVSPYFGYKFSDRFRLSAGGTYRVTVDAKTFELWQENRVYGFRTSGNYRIFNGWFGQLEVETLKMKISTMKPSFMPPQSFDEPRWTLRAYAGLFKTFGITKHLQGQTQMLYDFLSEEEMFHPNRLAFRCGLEYMIITKKRK